MADMDTSLGTFINRYPNYILTRSLDELRLAEYDRLDAQDMVYVEIGRAHV